METYPLWLNPTASCDTNHVPTSKCNQVTSLIYWLNSQILAHFSVSRNTNKDSCGVSSAACTFHIKWSHGTNNVSLGWRVCEPVLPYRSLHSLVGGGLKTILFSFWKEIRSLKPVSCFSWGEVVAEVKVHFMHTHSGCSRGNGRLDFSLRLHLVTVSRAVIFIRQAELHELGDIDSLCLWPFNQKRIPAENRKWRWELRLGVGRRGTGRPAAHNWFPQNKSRCGMVS